MMGKVVQFPVKDTKLFKWYDRAAAVSREINEAAGQAWVRKHVPSQFHRVIYGNLRVITKREGK